jgi:predicted DCC family thiol-disulfide oxidoreductase YuxK
MSGRPALLLYDGTCGFCARSVQFVLRHERRRRSLRFASLQSRAGTDVRERHPELHDVDSVIWLDPGNESRAERLYVRSAAVLHVLRYLGGPWRLLAALGALVPSAIRDAAYNFVALHRQRLAGGGPACLLPTAAQRTRFVEGSITDRAGTGEPQPAPDRDC